MTAPSIATFLMFTGQAEAAMNLYVSLFEDSRIDDVVRAGPGDPAGEGTVKLARFTLAGRPFMCIDSPPAHAFSFTPSMSLFVTASSPADVDRWFGVLSEGGKVMMPLGEYPFSARFGWVEDRFGVSWQLSLAPR